MIKLFLIRSLEVAQGLISMRKHVVSVSQPVERIYVMADSVRLAARGASRRH